MTFLKKHNNQSGFTLIEIILSMVVAVLIFGTVTQILLSYMNTYKFIAARKSTISNVRHAIQKINHDLLRINHNNIQDISQTGIDFIDADGQSTTYHLSSQDDNMVLLRGNDVIIPNVDAFSIEYLDSTGNVLTPTNEEIENIGRIRVSILCNKDHPKEEISMSTTITPRSFVGYLDYH